MKTFFVTFIFGLFFVSTLDLQAQEYSSADGKTIVSDEFHFIAFFPDQPIKTEGEINTRFGKGYSRRWTLESSGIFYEVSVDDFPSRWITNH